MPVLVKKIPQVLVFLQSQGFILGKVTIQELCGEKRKEKN